MPKKENIRRMFDSIAPSYDRLNHLMSLSVDKAWRRRALGEIVDGTPQRILDIACGTGDSTISIARAAAPGSVVTGADISEGMLALVAEKVRKVSQVVLSETPPTTDRTGQPVQIRLMVADGENLPFEDGSFDRVSCAFGIRNFEHRETGLREFLRVLRPGGKAVILELSMPRGKILRFLYGLYFFKVMPWIGGRISGDKAAYKYLPASVKAFPSPEQFCRIMQEAGFSSVRFRTFSMGLCRMFIGQK